MAKEGKTLSKVWNNHLLIFFLIFVFFSLTYFGFRILLPKRLPNHLVAGDGIMYYIYLPSLIFDRDLDLSNNYLDFDDTIGWGLLKVPRTGYPPSPFAFGPALLAAPFFLLGYLLFLLFSPFLPQGSPYFPRLFLEGGYCLASIFYSFLAAIIIYRFLNRYFPKKISFYSTLGIWLGTNALYYSLASPSYSHMTSLFVSSLFLSYWDKTRGKRKAREWAVLGLLGGLASMVRWQNSLFLAIPLVESLILYSQLLKRRKLKEVGKLFLNHLLFLLFLVLAFSPHSLVWKAIYDKYLLIPQNEFRPYTSGFIYFLKPAFHRLLFSRRHGLITWTPLYGLALLGFLLVPRKRRTLSLYLLLGLSLQLYLASAVCEWWAGEAFGARRLISSGLIFAFGIASFYKRLEERYSFNWVRRITYFFLLYNGLFFIQYWAFLKGYVHMDVYPGFKQLVIDKFIIPFRLLSRL
ncbi:MAG: glycosyltransferase family 39 protein [Acidobacteria bacterium]|nr:glycosyltransferase family 39 protein [Acidobacteriota bacterium]